MSIDERFGRPAGAEKIMPKALERDAAKRLIAQGSGDGNRTSPDPWKVTFFG
jgi:hypothetical protein